MQIEGYAIYILPHIFLGNIKLEILKSVCEIHGFLWINSNKFIHMFNEISYVQVISKPL